MNSSSSAVSSSLFADAALLPSGWQRNVLLQWDSSGNLCSVQSGVTRSANTPRAPGPIVSGMPNLHSHAFQRAMAGLTETLGDPKDSFWSWRTLMYRFAQRLRPEQLLAIAEHLYIEMLKAGYTSVCEFHYIHHAANGMAYDNPAELAEQMVQAADQAGIGLTLLPVLYQHSGFGATEPLAHQRRFIASPEWILDLRQRLKKTFVESSDRRYGVAPHSLRAVGADALQRLVEGIHLDQGTPIHIHIAEQTHEVDQCLDVLGQRPVEWLLGHQHVNAQWCLVHATHMNEFEYSAVAASGATVGLCPSTEANLGDGIFDAQRYLTAGGRWGIGSDSNTCVDPLSELRLLEYGQRLTHRRRNVLASMDVPVVADRLYQEAIAGGAAATGRSVAGLAVGQRADFVVLNDETLHLNERQTSLVLSGLMFGEHGRRPIRDVYVGGRPVVIQGVHPREAAARQAYRKILANLMDETA